MRSYKTMLFQSAVPVAMAGMAVTLCPLVEDKNPHTHTEQQVPVVPVSRAAVMYGVNSTTTMTATAVWPLGTLDVADTPSVQILGDFTQFGSWQK